MRKRAEQPQTRRTSALSSRRSRPRLGWTVVRVVLRGQGGEELTSPPGRDLLVSDTHTFEDLAVAIDRAFARWDLSHLHEFRLADGSRVGMIDPAGVDDDAPGLDERRLTLRQAGLRLGDSFEYVFDFGGSWEHLCSVLRDEVDPVRESGASSPSDIVPLFGWGTIPDQYGRTTPNEDDE